MVPQTDRRSSSRIKAKAVLIDKSQQQQKQTKAVKRRQKKPQEAEKATDPPPKDKTSRKDGPERAMSLASSRSLLLLGAHVSVAGGLHNAFGNARAIGAASLALFVRNQRRWEAKPLAEAEAVQFRAAMAEAGFSPEAVVPHGSYLINCASPNPEVRRRSQAALVDEMDRCRRLGLVQYNLHPGSAGAGADSQAREAAIARLAESLAAALAAVPDVRLLLENAAGQGGCLGGSFVELGAILESVRSRGLAVGALADAADADSRLGVCLDTCHAFAYGYELRTQSGLDAALAELATALGGDLNPLRALHLNDSLGDLACRRDRHADIGVGKIGDAAFCRLLRHPALAGRRLPAVLETPGVASYARQLDRLRGLAGADDDAAGQ